MNRLLFFLLLPALVSHAKETNRFNLPEKPTAPRFQAAEKSWPETVGEAEICLWQDDKLAALSLGVDDNFPGEVDWWKEQAELYDFQVTWFLVSGRIMKEGRSSNGLWSQYQELHNLGHGVESHTVTHLHVLDPGWGTPEWDYAKARSAKPATGSEAAADSGYGAASPENKSASDSKPEQGAALVRLSAEELAAARLAAADKPATDVSKGIEWEYAISIKQIEENIPGLKVSALAYPGGKNTIYNDRKTAAKYFRVARGATGAPNKANQTDYMSTNAMSSWSFDSANSGNVHTILDPGLYKGIYYRGWAVLFAHGVSANPDLFKRTFEFIKENRGNLWVGLYTDVAKYGQERDTATLRVGPPEPGRLTFTLTDEMDDSYFKYPLTIKMRIPDDWKEISAVQAGKPVGAKVLEHGGGLFALVQAMPDAGPVAVAKNL